MNSGIIKFIEARMDGYLETCPCPSCSLIRELPEIKKKEDEQIKQLAEAIYKSLWDYKGLTRHEDMMPYFEDIIRKSLDNVYERNRHQ